MPPRRTVAARKSSSTADTPKQPTTPKPKRRSRHMSTDSTQGEVPVEVKTDEAGGETAAGTVSAAMDRDRLIDIADEVYHAHDEDDEEIEEEWENSFDVPRLDFYFTDHATHFQRTLVYRTAVLFSTAPPSAPLHVDEYVEEWVDRCNVDIAGKGGPLTMEQEEQYHMDERTAREQQQQQGEEGEEEGEGEQDEEEETECKPYMVVFPTAKRVIDFIAYLGTDGLYNIWMKTEDEGEDAADEDEYEPKTRLWWRMNESEWIPAYC